ETLARQALGTEGLKLVVTVPSHANAPALNFGLDSRVRVVQLPPLTTEQSDRILTAAGAEFDYSLSSWIVAQSGGNPGVLLAAARTEVDLRQTGSSLVNAIAADIAGRMHRPFGVAAFAGLRRLILHERRGVLLQ